MDGFLGLAPTVSVTVAVAMVARRRASDLLAASVNKITNSLPMHETTSF